MSLIEKYKTIPQMQAFLRNIDSACHLGKKDNYIARLQIYQKVLDFPWRADQREVIDKVTQNKTPYYVINGIFGCGKTTLLFGILINLILKGSYKPSEVMFISFNVCIRNELRQKLKPYGFKGKIKVSTFDSIIYFICKHYNYEHLDLPNFDGKRRFCQKLCEEGKAKPCMYQPKIIFIDEVQDLERNTINIFRNFYPNTSIVFAGDVFQSIQKEPRDSLLWYLMYHEEFNIEKFYMNITPRVPRNILGVLKNTLQAYYPEFKEGIDSWTSTNDHSDATIEWQRFYSYRQIFDIAKERVKEFGEENTMILTFSSAITVKGALGDVARLRRNFMEESVDVNKNHKKLDSDKLFLSTANSSKGLERDHVIVFLTFPLEKAFSNFSDDIVINLITVAITRAKKSVHFYVPAYEDKFSRALTFFEKCPNPNKQKIRKSKSLDDYTFQDFMESERAVTELIRQSIILYDTRIAIKEFIKAYQIEKCFPGEVTARRPSASCEEEAAMLGVIIENLMTSTWSGKWPYIDRKEVDNLSNHPMYIHIFKKIDNLHTRYSAFSNKGTMNNTNQFKGIYLYSQLHLAMYNKLFINFHQENLKVLENYWYALKPKIISSKPPSDKLHIQCNMRMPYLTGIADAIFDSKSEKYDEICIWEIKASVDINWKDDALTQAFLYALMSGKSWSRLTLINPFRNEKSSYYFRSSNIMTLRNKVYQDILTWNFNCWLAKNKIRNSVKKIKIEDYYFAYSRYEDEECPVCLDSKKLGTFLPCNHKICWQCGTKLRHCPLCRAHVTKLNMAVPKQLTVIQFIAPSKAFVVKNDYYAVGEKKERKDCCKEEKLCLESGNTYDEDWHKKLKKKIFYINGNFHELVPKVEDWVKEIDFVKNEDLNYSMDFNDGLIILFCYLHKLAKEYKFT